MDSPPVGTVVEAIRHMNYHTGEFVYFLKIEYDIDSTHHHTVTVNVNQRDWMRFGREGARICLYPFGQVWRIGACRD